MMWVVEASITSGSAAQSVGMTPHDHARQLTRNDRVPRRRGRARPHTVYVRRRHAHPPSRESRRQRRSSRSGHRPRRIVNPPVAGRSSRSVRWEPANSSGLTRRRPAPPWRSGRWAARSGGRSWLPRFGPMIQLARTGRGPGPRFSNYTPAPCRPPASATMAATGAQKCAPRQHLHDVRCSY
jgi:hypothetical protein